MKRLDIGVIGGGTAGSSAAAFLARQGHAVTVYERVESPGPVGAGITLQPTGLFVLDALGVKDRVVARGAKLDGLLCTTASARTLIELAYKDVGQDVFGLGIHRGVIFQHVHEAAKNSGARIVCGVTCENLVRGSKTKSGKDKRLTIVDPDDNFVGNHELVIVADGAKSHLRDDTVIPKSVAAYPWGALWFVAKDHEHQIETRLIQRVERNRRMLGLLPTGLGPDSDNVTPLVSVFYSLHADRVNAWRARGLDAWKKECVEFLPESAPFIAQIQSADQVLFTQYHDVEMYPWNTGNVVYLGDAAHAMSPQLGQGCNLALMDAMVLAQSIATHSYLPEALDNYSRTRRAHLGFYQWATRMLTPFFQGDEEWFGILRDLGMPVMMMIPWLKKMMTLSMCGTLTSVFGKELALIPHPASDAQSAHAPHFSHSPDSPSMHSARENPAFGELAARTQPARNARET